MAYNVLIVDDSRAMRSVLKKVIAASGFPVGECHEAENGAEALAALAARWIDVVISDIHMPVLDGFGLFRAMRGDPALRDLPVVFVTTEASGERLSELMALGARGYLRKPFRPEEFRGVLGNVLGDPDGMAQITDGCDF